MKGLIIKDLMCLKKQLIIFGYVVVSVLVLSIMFVLSSQFGNLAIANQEMMVENSMTDMDIVNLSTVFLMLFMLLPIAMVGDFACVFEEDGKAGFEKVSAILPLSLHKRILSKYMTILMMFGAGVGIDLLIAFVLSIITDLISFADFFGIIIAAASVMSIYGSLVIVFCFLFGHGKEDLARIATVLLLLGSIILLNFSKIKMILFNVSSETGTLPDFRFVDFIKQQSGILFMAAVFVMFVSFFVSVTVAKRKRGIV